eukprot:m.309316 g.309316  ORF g.309316 m.309316 type:complete len:219 (+) comp46068_c0_seq1:12-668(+)
MSQESAQVAMEKDWGEWIVDPEVKEIFVKLASHQYRKIGRALLGGNREIENVKSALINQSGTTYENNEERLKQLFLDWKSEKKLPPEVAIEELLQVREFQAIGGIVKLEVPELDKEDGDRSKKCWEKMISAVARHGASKYTLYGTVLLGKSIKEVEVMYGASQVDNELIMGAILDRWHKEKGKEATVEAFLVACEGAYVGGIIRDAIEKLPPKKGSLC